jgi:hypothetical protein
MIESIMYMGIGFLVAALIGVAVMPLVHNRAVRLTTRRLEAAMPLSIAEVHADKDLLRAEFAMATRRSEIMIEQLKAKTASQLIELGKKSDGISRLKLELNTFKVVAAKVVATYSSRKPVGPTIRQPVRDNILRREAVVPHLLSVFARRRSSERTSRIGELSRRAG